MFDLSFAEIIVIMLVGLMVVGPNEIPSVVRAVVKGIRSLKHWATGIKKQVTDAIDLDELQETADELNEATGKHFILDDDGNYREVYDIQSFIEDKKAEKALEEPQTEREHG